MVEHREPKLKEASKSTKIIRNCMRISQLNVKEETAFKKVAPIVFLPDRRPLRPILVSLNYRFEFWLHVHSQEPMVPGYRIHADVFLQLPKMSADNFHQLGRF